MITKYKFFYSKILYIFFVFLSLIIFFFSTTKVESKAFDIDNIEITEPFEINFNKKRVIEKGFKKAFFELISLIVSSLDINKVSQTNLKEIKGMVESFSIKEEKFINEVYYVSLGVSFNKKKVFDYLEKKNIFPSIPLKKKILFIPIIIDESQKDLLIFSNNKFYNEWNNYVKSFHLINYVLPTEDLEDLKLLKDKFDLIEEYDFKEITNKYSLEDSIISLIFKDKKEVRILSKISIDNNTILKNQSYFDLDINDSEQILKIIDNLKTVYEDYWKNYNQINTSIRLDMNIKIDSNKKFKISNFEKILDETDLISDFYITKFDKDFVYYKITYNGTPNNFLIYMSKKNFNFNTQNRMWILE